MWVSPLLSCIHLSWCWVRWNFNKVSSFRQSWRLPGRARPPSADRRWRRGFGRSRTWGSRAWLWWWRISRTGSDRRSAQTARAPAPSPTTWFCNRRIREASERNRWGFEAPAKHGDAQQCSQLLAADIVETNADSGWFLLNAKCSSHA